MKTLKFQSKLDLAEPQIVDEVRLVSVVINFRDGPFEAIVGLFDDGEIVAERPIHIGLASVPAMGLDIDKLESDILTVIQNSGVLPDGDSVDE